MRSTPGRIQAFLLSLFSFLFSLSSANLGYLGILGERHFHCCFGASTLCVPEREKGTFAEDTEAAEVRREKQSRSGFADAVQMNGFGAALGFAI
jgi:hypothetical protein